MASARHQLLFRRSNALRKHLLPKRASLTGNYTKRQTDGIAGYFLLIHAELESYLEDRSLEVLDASYERWKHCRSLSRPLFGIMTYYSGERKGPPASFDPNQYKDRNLDLLIGSAIAQHRGRIKRNNGVKEGDLCEMLFPLGFSYSDLSTTLVASLDSFGTRRGNFAHQTLGRTPVTIDPFVEATTVDEIIRELLLVDELFSKLLADCRPPKSTTTRFGGATTQQS